MQTGASGRGREDWPNLHMKIAAGLYHPHMDKLGIEILRRDDGVTVLRLSGSAGIAEEATMSRPLNGLAAARPQRLIVDLSGLDFIASLAIGQIVSVVRATTSHGGAAAIASPDANIRQALLRCGLDRLVPVCASLDEAEQAVAGATP